MPPALTWLLRVPEIKSVEQLGSSELAMNRWRVPESFSQLFEALAIPSAYALNAGFSQKFSPLQYSLLDLLE